MSRRTEAEVLAALKAGEDVSRAELREHMTPEAIASAERIGAEVGRLLMMLVEGVERENPRLTRDQAAAIACRRLQEPAA